MKPQSFQTLTPRTTADASTLVRFQIFRQTREGIYVGAFKTDSAIEAVGAFLRQAPVFEGGEVRLWDNREQHLSAWVRWISESTGNAVSALKRENVFQDRMLAILARHVEVREAVRENFTPAVRMCM